MINKTLLTIALLSTITLQANDVVAPQIEETLATSKKPTNNGLLGATYIKAYVGKTSYGDTNTAHLVDSNIQYGVNGQFKINENISLGGGVEMLTADIDYQGVTGDASGTALYLEGLYHFLPNGTIDPFISLGLAYVSTDVDMTYQGQTYSESDSDNGYQFAAGAEFDLTNKIFLTPAFSYSKIGDNDASKNISVELNAEVTENIFIGGRVSIETEESDTSYYLSLGFKF